MKFVFGLIEIDLVLGRIFRDGTEVALRPKAFTLLSYLLRNAGRVVPKDELLGAVWPGVIVTEDSLTRCVHEIRQALGPENGSLLRTVARRGYLFVEGDRPPVETRQPDALPDAPARPLRRDGIAVLPFVLVESSPVKDGIILDGLVQEVIGRLARARGFHVIARGSTFALRHLASDPATAGRALGVQHVVTGSAIFRDQRMRLQVEIVETESAGILWSGEFSEDLLAYAELIGSLSDRIAFTIQRQISLSEARRAQSLPREGLTAWEHFHAGLGDIYSSDPTRLGAALSHFQSAADIEPRFARAHSGQSVCHWVMAFSGMAPDPVATATAARETAKAGLDADGDDPYTQWCFGRAVSLFGDMAEALRRAEMAIEISPGFSYAHYDIAAEESMRGDAARALAHAEKFIDLSPFDQILPSVQAARAHAALRLGHMSRAVEWAKLSVEHPQTFATILAPAALILAEAEDIDGAQHLAARLRAMGPDRGVARVGETVSAMSETLARLYRRHGTRLQF